MIQNHRDDIFMDITRADKKPWLQIDEIVLFGIGVLYSLLFLSSFFFLIRTLLRRKSEQQHLVVSSGGYISVSTLGTINSGSLRNTLQIPTVHRRSKKMGWQLMFHPLMMIGCSIRSAYFFMAPFITNKKLIVTEWVQVTVTTLPSFVFFSDFLIIIFLWAELYHNAQDQSLRLSRLRPLFVALNLAMYSALCVLYGINFSIAGDDHVVHINNATEIMIVILSSIVYLITSMGFLLYGCKLYSKLRGRHSLHTQTRRNVLARIKFITSIVTVCFLIRAVFVFATVFIAVPLMDEWWFFSVYYIALELFPLAMMVRLLHAKPAKQPQHLPDTFASVAHVNV